MVFSVCLSISDGCFLAGTKGEVCRGRPGDASSMLDNIQGNTKKSATLHLCKVCVMYVRVLCDNTNGVSFKYAPIQFEHGFFCFASGNSYVDFSDSFSFFSNFYRKTSNRKFIAKPLKVLWFGGASNCNNFESNN